MSPRRLRRIAVGIRLARLAYAVSVAEVGLLAGSSDEVLRWRLRAVEHLRDVWPPLVGPLPMTERVRLPVHRRDVREARKAAGL